ncbi:MAG: SIR2 family protein [Isosphaeraceae bacterium]|nr:SIR2 family protein [Isosphaeraceae bacterium]
MSSGQLEEILEGVRTGKIVPYLGPGVLADVTSAVDGSPIPAEDEALILAMNGGQPLNRKLMEEFPRAAMHLELKKGRKFLTNFLFNLYDTTRWTGGAVHEWLAALGLPYVIDTNRDLRLQDLYANRPHTLVAGIARIAGTDYRFRLWEHDGAEYRAIDLDAVNSALPVLFKPLGTPRPDATYIASDADFVDYITELMGGFAVPHFVKQSRQDKRYLVMGLRLTRDTQRMILSDLIVDAASPAGWVLIANPTAKERRYCESKNLEIVECGIGDLLAAAASQSIS